MSDFVSGFWNLWVAGLTLFGIVFCAVILWANTTKKLEGPAELHGHVWDEDLAEYNHPLPRWWMYLFWITIVFALAYLALYPGFGSNKGIWNWSSKDGPDSQYAKEMADAKAKYEPIFAKFRQQDLKAVAGDREAREMGQRLYLTYCSQCHGSDARGAKGFPNLTDNDWLWGGEPEQIKTTIMEGRSGVMPPFGPQLAGDQIKDVANYVRSLSNLAHDSVRAQRGKEVFQTNCVACHGPEAKGNIAMGAPNLTDGTWLYGSTEATITETVTKGRNNRMPAHKEFLGEAKVHLLAAYVIGLSQGSAQATK